MPATIAEQRLTTIVDGSDRPTGVTLLVNSALASTVGLVIAVLADSLGRFIVGWLVDRDPIIYHDRVEFLTGDNPLALAGGALAALIVGASFLAIYPASRRHDPARLCVLWLILHCFRQGFVPMALAGVDRQSDVALALTHFDLPAGIDMVVGVGGAIGLLLVSLAAAPAFLAFATSRSEIATPPRRVGFVARIGLGGGLAGALLAVLFFVPDTGSGLVSAIPLFGLFTAATLLSAPGSKAVEHDPHTTARRFSWGLVAAVVILFVVFRFALARGIPIPPDPETFFVS
ncbi:hypothetical protein BH18ACT6_BH18ACT6_16120 [soil metagenome]